MFSAKVATCAALGMPRAASAPISWQTAAYAICESSPPPVAAPSAESSPKLRKPSASASKRPKIASDLCRNRACAQSQTVWSV